MTDRTLPWLVWMSRILAATLVLASPFVVNYGWRGMHRLPVEPEWNVTGGDARRGREEIVRHGCGACHTIPGVRVATGRVGPQLVGIRDQIFLGGVLENGPENMIAWVREPQRFNPRTAMPDLGLTDQQARDIAAYLFHYRGR